MRFITYLSHAFPCPVKNHIESENKTLKNMESGLTVCFAVFCFAFVFIS